MGRPSKSMEHWGVTMINVSISRDEAYPVYTMKLAGPFHNSHPGDGVVEITEEICEKWKRVQEDYDAMQKEMRTFYQEPV